MQRHRPTLYPSGSLTWGFFISKKFQKSAIHFSTDSYYSHNSRMEGRLCDLMRNNGCLCCRFYQTLQEEMDGDRPRKPDREILEGILWILKTGAQWHELPREYTPYQTCHRRFQEWAWLHVFEEILRVLAQNMVERGKMTDNRSLPVAIHLSSASPHEVTLVEKTLASRFTRDGRLNG